MGRMFKYKDEWTLEVHTNALDLIKRVNNLFNALEISVPPVTSGWRPAAINAKASGAKKSLHMVGKAVDLADSDGSIKEKILNKPYLLLDYGLWMEHPDATPGWVHLDTGVRSSRLIKVFKP